MLLKLQYNQMATVLIHQLEGWPERFLFFRCRAEGDRVSIDFETLQYEKPDSLTLIIVWGFFLALNNYCNTDSGKNVFF